MGREQVLQVVKAVGRGGFLVRFGSVKLRDVVDCPKLNEAALLGALMALFGLAQSIPNIGLVPSTLDFDGDNIAPGLFGGFLDNDNVRIRGEGDHDRAVGGIAE